MLRRVRRIAGRSYARLARSIFREAAPSYEAGLDRVGSDVHSFGERYRVLQFADCTVWPHFSVAADGALFSETALCPAKMDWLQHRLRRYPTLKIRGCVTSIGDIWHNYYHRYVDLIPKAYALHTPSLKHRDITLLLTGSFRRDDERILTALLPPNVTVRHLPRYVRVAAETYLHLPRLSTNPAKPCKNDSSIGFLPDDYLEIYRRTVSRVFDVNLSPSRTGRNLYVSRRKAGKRRIFNDDALVEALRDFEFEVVYLEDYALRDQIVLFAQAPIILAQHGAGLTNILYASSGSALIELVSSTTRQEIHYSLGAVKLGMRYYRIQLETEDGRKDADGFVDVGQVRTILEGHVRSQLPGHVNQMDLD